MKEYGHTKDRGAFYEIISIKIQSMKKTFINLFLLLTFIVGVESCVPRYIIRVVNNSRRAIYVHAGYIRPDSLPVHKPHFLLEIPDKTTMAIYDTDVNDPKFSRLHREKITVFILDKDKVDKYDWATIREGNMILKKYVFNWQEFIEMGAEVVYP